MPHIQRGRYTSGNYRDSYNNNMPNLIQQFQELINNNPDIFGPNSDLKTPWPTPYGWNPPKEWFQPDPNYQLGESVVITPQGQFKAWSHDWETYHIGTTASGEEQAWRAEPSPTGNKAFHQGIIETLDGTIIETGVIPMAGGHADPYATPQDAQAHYDNPEWVRVAATANDTDTGCQINGMILPYTTFDEVATMRLMGLSGDWRWFPQLAALDYIGPCFVPRQGLPKGVATASISAAVNLTTGPMFKDSKTYNGSWDDQNKLIAVTAAAVNTVTIKTMDKIENKYKLEGNQETVTASPGAETIGGESIEIDRRIEKLENDLEQLYELVYQLQTANETIEQIDKEQPDS